MSNEPWLAAIVVGVLGFLLGALLRALGRCLVALFLVLMLVEVLATFQMIRVPWDLWSKLTEGLSQVLPEVKELCVSLLHRSPRVNGVVFLIGLVASLLVRRA